MAGVIVHGNLWVAIGGAALAAAGCVALGTAPDPLLCALVPAGAAAVYTLDRLPARERAADRRTAPERTAFVGRHGRVLAPAAWAAVGLTGVLAAAAGPAVFAACAALGVTAALYGGRCGLPCLKRRAWCKLLLPLAGWTTACAVLPALLPAARGGATPGAALAWTSLAAGVVAANLLLCDLRDRAGDRRRGRDTLPLRWGPRRTRVVAAACLWAPVPVALACAALQSGRAGGGRAAVIAVAAAAVAAVATAALGAVTAGDREPGERAAAWVVDGWLLLPLPAVLLAAAVAGVPAVPA